MLIRGGGGGGYQPYKLTCVQRTKPPGRVQLALLGSLLQVINHEWCCIYTANSVEQRDPAIHPREGSMWADGAELLYMAISSV
jgi:hypothetical protein